jgi:hypothetical protein
MLGIRWILVGLSLALSIALIARGDVLIGGLLGALAVARMAMFLRIQQRREQFRRQRGQGGRRGQNGRPPRGRWQDGR